MQLKLTDFVSKVGRGRPKSKKLNPIDEGFGARIEMMMSRTGEMPEEDKAFLDSIIRERRDEIKSGWTPEEREDARRRARTPFPKEIEGVEYIMPDGHEYCYVDSLQHCESDRFGEEKLCHMSSECIRSLTHFANALGISRTRIRIKSGYVYYVLRREDRVKAINSGAIAASRALFKEKFILPAKERTKNLERDIPNVRTVPSTSDACEVCLEPFNKHSKLSEFYDHYITCALEVVTGEVE